MPEQRFLYERKQADGSTTEQAWLFPGAGPWLGLLACALALGLVYALSPLTLAVKGADYQVLATVAGFFLLGVLYAHPRGMVRVSAALQGFAFIVIALFIAAAWQYPGLALGLPWADGRLARADAVLGYDWKRWLLQVDGSPLLSMVLYHAYVSIMGALFAAAIIMLVMGRLRRLREFLLLFASGAVITGMIGGLMPALGAFHQHGVTAAMLRTIPYEVGSWYHETLVGVHDGRILAAGPDGAMIAIPSFHTFMALLLPFSLRGTWLSWPALILSLLVLLATPVFGNHYFIDMVAGAAVFLACIGGVRVIGLLEESVAAGRKPSVKRAASRPMAGGTPFPAE